MGGKTPIAILLFCASAAMAQADWTLRDWETEQNSVAWTGPSSGMGAGQLAAMGEAGTIATSPGISIP